MQITVEQLQAIMPRMLHNPHDSATYVPLINAAMAEALINTRLRVAAFLAQIAHESCELRYMQEIADGSAYEGRADLGNTEPGDGPRYKGRGPLQLTGRWGYQHAGTALHLDLVNNPDSVATPQVGFRTSVWIWTWKQLNYFADASNFREITRRINGGFNGEEQREAYYQKALSVLPADPA